MNLKSTYTVVTLEVPRAMFDYVSNKLKAADYGHAFMDENTIDLSGIALVPTDSKEDWHLSQDRGAAVGAIPWLRIDKDTPRNVKVFLLNRGRVGTVGVYDGDSQWIGWFPMLSIPDDFPEPYWDFQKQDNTVQHVCGLQGFGRGMDGISDVCPACQVERQQRDARGKA